MTKQNTKQRLTDERVLENDALKEIFNAKKKALGLTQESIAEKMGMTQGAVGAYLRGINPLNAQAASLFAQFLQVSVEEFSPRLAAEIGNMSIAIKPKQNELEPAPPLRFWSSNDPLPEGEYVFAPFLKDVNFAGGFGAFEMPDYNGFRLPFGKSTLYRKGIQIDNVVCATLTGDSMERLIPDGTTIAIDKGDTNIRDGKIYAFEQGGLFRIKYLYRLPNHQIRIASENSDYADEIVAADEVNVIGRIFWWSVLV